MATIPKSIRVDENLYAEARKVFEKLGMPASVAINVFFEYVVREQGMPFALSLKKDGEEESRE